MAPNDARGSSACQRWQVPRRRRRSCVYASFTLGFGASCGLLHAAGPVFARPIAHNRPDVPPANPRSIENRFWDWRGYRVRYQAMGEDNAGPGILCVHGLFTNADHWRRNLPALAEAGFRAFAIDMLGCGYSDKPSPRAEELQALNGERGRELGEAEVELTTNSGGLRSARVPLAHSKGSVYNFYTWSEQLCDFVEEVMGPSGTVVAANSAGTLIGLQAAVDRPELFRRLLLVNPSFRAEHVAQSPPLARPVVSLVQALLRDTPVGKWVFDAAANPETVGEILREPYVDEAQVTDELVEVLLSPLLTRGAADVLLDTLSYNTGPVLEQLLQDGRLRAPVWVCWGARDPWTPLGRVAGLRQFSAVERLVEYPDVGHCPHDEAPHLVNSLLVECAGGVQTGPK